jgi:hypothetical protein
VWRLGHAVTRLSEHAPTRGPARPRPRDARLTALLSVSLTEVDPMAHGVPDLYAALGVPSGASPAEIRRAYRAIVRRYHPDRRPATDLTRDAAPDDALARAIAAYRVLGSPVRRADYDRRTVRHPPAVRSGVGVHGTGSSTIGIGAPATAVPAPIVAGPVRWQPPRR